jgi:signal peptidase
MLASQRLTVILSHAIKHNGWIELPAEGDSMFPLIRQGYVCRFTPCAPSQIRKGDILLFISDTGQLVAHRFYRFTGVKEELLHCKGDSNLGFDQPVRPDQVIGRLSRIQRRPRQSHTLVNSQWVFIWSRMIMLFPIFSFLLRMYLNKRIIH